MSGCAAGAGFFLCYEGLAAATSAAAGAIGYSVLTTQHGWQVAGFTCTSMTQAQVIGGVILGCPMAACLGTLVATSDEDHRNGSLSMSLLWSAITGALSGMLGGQILGLLTSGTQIGYAAAAGATGAAVVDLSIVGLILVVGGPIMCCAVAQSGEPVLIQIPVENVTNGNINSFEGATLVDPSAIGIQANNLADFTAQIANKFQQDAQTKHAPAEEEMQRNQLRLV